MGEHWRHFHEDQDQGKGAHCLRYDPGILLEALELGHRNQLEAWVLEKKIQNYLSL